MPPPISKLLFGLLFHPCGIPAQLGSAGLSCALGGICPCIQTVQMGHQHYWDTTMTLAMSQASSCLVCHKTKSKLGQAPLSRSFPWSSAVLPCCAQGCGSCKGAIASLASTALQLLVDCRQRNISRVLAPNEWDCPFKQNKKEVLLHLSA